MHQDVGVWKMQVMLTNSITYAEIRSIGPTANQAPNQASYAPLQKLDKVVDALPYETHCTDQTWVGLSALRLLCQTGL